MIFSRLVSDLPLKVVWQLNRVESANEGQTIFLML